MKMVSKKLFLERHFYYEIKMVRESLPHFNPDGSVFDVVLVGFLTHIRNLYEFFYGTGKGDKAHAGHFINSWRNKKPPREIKEWNTQINHFLSHLSYRREDRIYRPYPVFMLYGHFRGLTIDFINGLEEEYKTDVIKGLLETLKQG